MSNNPIVSHSKQPLMLPHVNCCFTMFHRCLWISFSQSQTSQMVSCNLKSWSPPSSKTHAGFFWRRKHDKNKLKKLIIQESKPCIAMPSFPGFRTFRKRKLPGSSEIHVSNLVMRSSQADGINLHGKVSHATVSKVPGCASGCYEIWPYSEDKHIISSNII